MNDLESKNRKKPKFINRKNQFVLNLLYLTATLFLFGTFLFYETIKPYLYIPAFSFISLSKQTLFIRLALLFLCSLTCYGMVNSIISNKTKQTLRKLNQLLSSFSRKACPLSLRNEKNQRDNILSEAEKNLFKLGKLLRSKHLPEESINLLVETKQKISRYKKINLYQIPERKISQQIWNECINCIKFLKP